MNLLVTELPGLGKTLTDVLGEGWRAEACYGDLRDFPARTLGVDMAKGFEPQFRTAKGRGYIARRLSQAIAACDAVYFAAPPGRSYDLMAWHVQGLLPEGDAKPFQRITLTALTPELIREAVAQAEPLRLPNVDAEIADRIVNRLIGWQAETSPAAGLGLKIARTWPSAAALQLVDQAHAHREAARGWGARAVLEHAGQSFPVQILNRDDQPVRFSQATAIERLRTALSGAQFWVEEVAEETEVISPPPTLVTSDLLAEAYVHLNLTPMRTLTVLGVLYEAGWVTHPDGRPPEGLREAARAYIRREYGEACLSDESPERAGIAPTMLDRLPERLPGDGLRLYDLIWRGFVASQMAAANDRRMTVRLSAGERREAPFPITLRASLPQVAPDGWQKLYAETETPAPLSLAVEDEVRFVRLIAASPGSDQTLAQLSLTLRLHVLGWSAETAAQTVADLVGSGLLVAGEYGLSQPDAARLNGGIAAELLDPEMILRWRRAVAQIESGERTRREVLEAFWQVNGTGFRLEALPPRQRTRRPVLLTPVQEA